MKIFKTIQIIFLVIVVSLFLLFCCSAAYYFATREKAEKIMANDFIGLVKIPSVKKLYQNIVDLKAADYILSGTGFANIHKSLLDFRNTSVARSKLFEWVLDLPAYCAIDTAQKSFIVIDTGMKSLLLRFLDYQKLITLPGVEVTRQKEGKDIFYQVTSRGQTYYFRIYRNLLLIAPHKDAVIRFPSSSSSLYYNKALAGISAKTDPDALAVLYCDTGRVLEYFKGVSGFSDALIADTKFGSYSVLSFYISNEKVLFSLYTDIDPATNALTHIFTSQIPAGSALQYAPENTGLICDLHTGELKELYHLILSSSGAAATKKADSIETGIKMLLHMNIDELVFDWAGNEAGMISSIDAPYPLYFIKIKDTGKFNKMVEKLEELLIIYKDKDLVFDGVRLNRIDFPPVVRSLVDLFVPHLYMPYFTIKGGYLFISQDPGTVAALINNYKSNRTLPFNPLYKEAMKNITDRPDVLLFYTTVNGRFSLPGSSEMVNTIINLYQLGVIAVSLNEDSLRVELSAAGMKKEGVRSFPGYPAALKEGIKGDLVLKNITGSKVPECIYLDNQRMLHVTDINLNPLTGFPVATDGDFFVVPDESPQYLYTVSSRGALHRYGIDGSERAPYPVTVSYRGGVKPVDADGRLYYFSREEMQLKLLDLRSGKESDLPFSLSSPLITPPVVAGCWIFLAPRSFAGVLDCIDLQGNEKPGFPIHTGGLAPGAPLVTKRNGSVRNLYHLLQNGTLCGYSANGTPLDSYPVTLEGTYSTAPVAAQQKRRTILIALNTQGELSAVNEDGSLIAKRTVPGAGSWTKGKLLCFDINHDGDDEIFLYDTGAMIHAFTGAFEELDGFPVKGMGKPSFADIDRDGSYEMCVPGVNNLLYMYSIIQ